MQALAKRRQLGRGSSPSFANTSLHLTQGPNACAFGRCDNMHTGPKAEAAALVLNDLR
jgi:hypothetical protein